jgi:uncharacterized protein
MTDSQSYKPSRYNLWGSTDKNRSFLFNTRTARLLTFSTHDVEQRVKQVLSHPDKLKKSEEKLKSTLLENGYLLRQEVDEINILKIKNRLRRFRTDDISLTIAPTLDCNFRCIYCFESRKKEVMDDEVSASLIKFFEKEARAKGLFRILWFGGEPLLVFDRIKELTNRLSEICSAAGASYISKMSTNGYLLNKVPLDFFKKSNFSSIQVTIDGDESTHDKRRPLAGGKGTFKQIVSNTKNIIESGLIPTVFIRVNVDRNNSDRLADLLDELEKKGLKNKKGLGIYVAMVDDIGGICASVRGNIYGETQKFAELEVEFGKTLIEKGFYLTWKPTPRTSCCIADLYKGYVIAPKGDIYKCWTEIGDKLLLVGKITPNGKLAFNHNLTKWIAWDPFEQDECRECPYLPLGMGSCLYHVLRSDDRSKKHCPTIRYNLIEMLALSCKAKEKMGAKASFVERIEV